MATFKRIDAFVQSRTVMVLALLSLFLFVGAGPVLQHAATQALFKVRPVVASWDALRIERDGNDVLLSGTAVKRWQCAYQPPPIAETLTGAQLQTFAPTGREWPSDGNARTFGPWRIKDAAGTKFRLYLHHKCFDSDVLTPLGVVDATHL
jgi:hypothetical protein